MLDIDMVIQNPVKYSGPTIKIDMYEPVQTGKFYQLRIRKGRHSEYTTAWIYNKANCCIAVIPFVEENWDLSNLI